jgi:hypothetical protein
VPGRGALAFVLIVLWSCATGAGFRLVSAGGRLGPCLLWIVSWVVVAFLRSGWYVFLRGFFRLGCVLCRPVLLGRLCSLLAPLTFLLALLPHSSFPLRVSL